MVRRGIRWNKSTDTAEQAEVRYRYVFAIINSATEVRRIKEKIWEQLGTICELNQITDYLIPHSRGLHCNMFAFSSPVAEMRNPRDIYDNPSSFRFDRDLLERTEIDSLPYIERLVA